MKRLVAALFTFIILCGVFFRPPVAKAADTPLGAEGASMMAQNSMMNWLALSIMGACSDEETLPDTTNTDIIYFLQPFMTMFGQYFPGKCPQQLSYKNSTLSGLNTVTLALYSTPPASFGTFARDVGQTLGFIPKSAYAQGIGFSGLSVLLPIWKAFRNVAYALLALILIAIGFMVMFRKKIDPKTVVTVQNALPRVVVALLLVTFSYAIVGIMIDLMYFTIVLAAGIIVGAAKETSGGSLGFLVSGPSVLWHPDIFKPETWLPQTTNASITSSQVVNILLNDGFGGVLRFFFGSGFQAFDDIGKLILGNTSPTTSTAIFAIQGVLTYLIGGGGKSSAVVAGLTNGPVLLLILFLIVLVFGVVRLIFMLVDAYINIIISLIFSPFQLMLEAIPGTNSFSSWFRWLLAKVITFPVTAVLLMVAAFLTSQTNATKLWSPPLLSSGGGTTGMAGFIGLGMLLVIPTIVDQIQKALKAEAFIPGGVGAVVGPIGSGVGQLTQMAYQASFISSAIRHKPDARSPIQTVREGAQKGFGAITGQGSSH